MEQTVWVRPQVQSSTDRRQHPAARPLIRTEPACSELLALTGKSVLSVQDLSRSAVLDLFSVAAGFEHNGLNGAAASTLEGTIVLTAFFEPSTRTRLSFESAALRLGAKVISIPDGYVTSAQKGESLEDTVAMLQAYADIIIMRHPSDNAMSDLQHSSGATPLINAGDGWREHPTQALADWYAIQKWRAANDRTSARLSICVVGIVSRMRSLRSFILMGGLCFGDQIRNVVFLSSTPQSIDAEIATVLCNAGVKFEVRCRDSGDFRGFDIIYINSITFEEGKFCVTHGGIRLDAATEFKSNAVVMHPLARQSELCTSLDDTPHNLYHCQARGAVFVRQALLLALTGHAERICHECAGS